MIEKLVSQTSLVLGRSLRISCSLRRVAPVVGHPKASGSTSSKSLRNFRFCVVSTASVGCAWITYTYRCTCLLYLSLLLILPLFQVEVFDSPGRPGNDTRVVSVNSGVFVFSFKVGLMFQKLAMASNLLAMASNLIATANCLPRLVSCSKACELLGEDTVEGLLSLRALRAPVNA